MHVQVLGVRGYDPGFGGYDSEFEVWGSGCRVQGLGIMFWVEVRAGPTLIKELVVCRDFHRT